MTFFTLGTGRYCLAQSHGHDGCPQLTIRRLPKPEEVGTILEGKSLAFEDFDLIIDVRTPAAAEALLVVATAIAFAHGVDLTPPTSPPAPESAPVAEKPAP